MGGMRAKRGSLEEPSWVLVGLRLQLQSEQTFEDQVARDFAESLDFWQKVSLAHMQLARAAIF